MRKSTGQETACKIVREAVPQHPVWGSMTQPLSFSFRMSGFLSKENILSELPKDTEQIRVYSEYLLVASQVLFIRASISSLREAHVFLQWYFGFY